MLVTMVTYCGSILKYTSTYYNYAYIMFYNRDIKGILYIMTKSASFRGTH